MKHLLLLIPGFFLLCSCNGSYTRTNMPGDISDGKALAEKFYTFLAKHSVPGINTISSGIKPDEMNHLMNFADSSWGAMKSYEFTSGKSQIQKNNGVRSGEIDLYYKANYERSVNKETIIIEVVNDSLKVTGYDTHPDKQ
ncbi:MAG TPA: hypothetical protein VFU15_01415 [Bacteroidia bacterium]|nr:hypothetical protein [Bacteroidia bacterium]